MLKNCQISTTFESESELCHIPTWNHTKHHYHQLLWHTSSEQSDPCVSNNTTTGYCDIQAVNNLTLVLAHAKRPRSAITSFTFSRCWLCVVLVGSRSAAENSMFSRTVNIPITTSSYTHTHTHTRTTYQRYIVGKVHCGENPCVLVGRCGERTHTHTCTHFTHSLQTYP